jgi:hypothetical protein
MKRRAFLQRAAAAPALAALAPHTLKAEAASVGSLPTGRYSPGRIVNEYNLFLPGEREALKNSPRVLPHAIWQDQLDHASPDVIGRNYALEGGGRVREAL